jgi:EmrB/QacA subfamily drug resistance transporter
LSAVPGSAEGFRNPPAEELYARRWRIWSVVMIGLFMALIDITIVNIAIPQLQNDLHTEVDRVSWVLNGYNIAFAVFLVAMGRLADQRGRKLFFVWGMALFTFGSLLCALAWSIESLIAFRVLQGVGAAMLAPIALAMTTVIFPPAQRGLGLTAMAGVANGAAVLGPTIGGFLVEYAGWPWDAGWHWIFLINVPIGIVGILLGLRVIPETRDTSTHREVDWIGMALVGGAVFCLTYGLVEANRRGWGSTLIVALFAGAVLLAIAFAASQRFGRFPMLSGSLVRNTQFRSSAAAMLLFGVSVMSATFLVVLFMVQLWGYSELKAAVTLTILPATGLVATAFVARIADRVPPRRMAVPALLATGGGLLWASTLPATPDLAALIGPLVLTGGGIGVMFPAVNVGAMGSIRGQEMGLGSGIVNMSRQLGFTLGIAILVAVFTGNLDLPPGAAPGEAGGAGLSVSPEDLRGAFAAAFRAGAWITLAAIPFTIAMRRSPGEAGVAPSATG